MKIRYILGDTGTGKFTTCINEILKFQEENPDKKIIFIVPEQFSYNTESNLINNTNYNTIFNIQVLSFKRLSYHIFSEIGNSKKVVLEDYGQVMILRKILYNVQEKLLYFNNNSYTNIGLIEKILNILQDFFKYNVTIFDLDEFLNSDLQDESLYLKINDLRIIYKNYLDYLNKNYITSDEILDVLAENIDKSKLIDNAEVWIYGFTGFTPQELNVIAKLSKKVHRINIALPLNSANINIKDLYIFDPFYEVKSTIKKLEKIINENNLYLEEVYYLNENKRHLAGSQLFHLAKNYFSYDTNIYSGSEQNIQIFSCNNKYLEVENVAKKILTLVRDLGYKFKDIAIVMPDRDYEKTLNFIFNKYEIPYFLDFKKSIISHSLTNLVCSALDIIIYNWSYSSVFQYLKTDFILGYGDENFTIKKDDINALENYVIAYGIKGYKWRLTSWDYGFGEYSQFDKEHINKVKEYVLKSMQKFEFDRNKKYSVREISIKMMDFLLELNVLQNLEMRATWDREFLKDNNYGNTSKYEEHYQVWNSIVSTLEKLVEILGEEEVTIEEYSKILKAGFEKTDFALYPLMQDQVIIGDFRRSRFPKVKAMFVMSVNEGVIPSFADDTDIISDTEKVALLSKGIEMSPSSVQLICQENFYIYWTITKPTEKLFLTYLSSDLNGQSKKPSFIIHRIVQLFENLNVQNLKDLSEENILNEIYNPKATFDKIFEISRSININEECEKTLVFKDILSWFLRNEEYNSKLLHIENGLETLAPKNYLFKESLDNLYPNNYIFSSVSKLEKFNSCPFSYFLQYNLNVNDRKAYQVNSLDFGLFYHGILEKFSRLVFNENVDYKNLTYADVDKFIEIAVDEYVTELDTDIFISSKRNKYFLENVKNISKNSSYAIIKQIKNGAFIPYGFEVEFNSSSNFYDKSKVFTPIIIDLKNDYKMFLNGKIDRVDLLYNENDLYIKILDYKSSDRKIDFNHVYYGLQLQLIMYLDAFIKSNKNNFNSENILPAGLFYFKLNSPILSLDKVKKKDDFAKKVDEIFNIKGIYSDDEVVKKGIDLSYKTEKAKKLTGISSSEMLTREQFSKLTKFINILTREIGEEITKGSIKINPYKSKNGSACQYCIYKSICNIEVLASLEGGKDSFGYNILQDVEKDKFWELVDKKIDDEN